MNNPFLVMDNDELLEVFNIYKNELRKNGSTGTQPLRGLLDQYYEFYKGSCLPAIEVDLLYAAAERFAYFKNLTDHCNMSWAG